MSFQTQMRPDFIPPSVTNPVNLPAPANSPYQPLQPGNGQFSGQVAGTAPQQDIDLQLAQMANDSYTLSGPDGVTGTQSEAELEAAGWNRLQPEGDHLVDADGNVINIDPASLESNSGFRAAIYQNDQGQYVVAFAGTNPKEMGDIKADATQAFGMDTRQYNQAIALAKEAEVAFGDGNVVFTGHSLGGGLASAAALAVDASAVTFNAAGLSNQTLRDLGLNPNAARSELADSGQVRRYVVNGDPLTLAQQDIPALPIPFAPPLSPPDAVGHELRIQAPAGTTPIIGAHGGSGDNTTYVEALKQNTPYEPANPLDGTLAGLGIDAFQNFSEFNFNTLGNTIDTVADLAGDAINVGKDTVAQIKDVVATDFADGDYVEGTASILGDVVDGGLDLAGDTASGAVSWAGGTVENATDFTGSLLRDLGEFTGLQKPADAIAGVIESAGSTLSDWADAGGGAIEWATDKLGDGGEWLLDKAGDGAQWLTDKTVEGAIWTGGKIVDGAVWTGEKIVDGVTWTGGKIADGAAWAGGKIADGASWVGDKVSKAMPWNW